MDRQHKICSWNIQAIKWKKGFNIINVVYYNFFFTHNKCVPVYIQVCSTWYDLQQQHKFKAISKILFNVLDLCPGFPQVGVTPSCEGLTRKRKKYVLHIFLLTKEPLVQNTSRLCVCVRNIMFLFSRTGSKLPSQASTVHFNYFATDRGERTVTQQSWNMLNPSSSFIIFLAKMDYVCGI